jgi:hypothetical protein
MAISAPSGSCATKPARTTRVTSAWGSARRPPAGRDKLAATNERCLAQQAELLASPVDSGQLAALAAPTLVGQRRIPGLKLHDDRVVRLLETLLQPGASSTTGLLASCTHASPLAITSPPRTTASVSYATI